MTRERLVEIIGMMGVGGFGEQSAADLILQELAKEKQEAPAGLVEELREWQYRYHYDTTAHAPVLMKEFDQILSRYQEIVATKDYHGYRVYPTGRIEYQNVKGEWFVLKPYVGRDGYIRNSLTINGKNKTCMMHRILAECFVPNPHKKPHINHKNGIKIDNALDNLEWVTHSENIQHAFDTGLCQPLLGEDNPRAKLTDDEVRQIRKYGAGKPRGYTVILSKKYGVIPNTIHQIVNGKTWKHIPSEDTK